MPMALYSTAKTGRWTDPATWKGGQVPVSSKLSSILINPKHTVTFDAVTEIADLTISKGGTLSFDRQITSTLKPWNNALNLGRLIMKPASYLTNHKIQFLGINESKFKGSSMDVLPDDIGLWVRGDGIIELVGSPKTAWLRLIESALNGSISITLNATPVNWRVGDEISIAPTSSPDTSNFFSGFEIRKIVAIKGKVITLDAPLKNDHPAVIHQETGAKYTAEVINLTRNVSIEGTGDGEESPATNGRGHINIMTTAKVNISNVQIRHMGPRMVSGAYTQKILGRYPLHIHMCGDATQGSIIDGVVVRDCGSHAFVPHASHGITFKNCVSYNTFNCAYWWDLPPDNGVSDINNTNDTIFDNNIAALTRSGPAFRGYRLAGFMLGSGLRNVIRNCVGIGNHGNSGAASFIWPESSNYTDNLWIFENNMSHNNKTDGIFTWQNDPHSHIVNGYIAYNHGVNGIEHGAYSNAYKYKNIILINNRNGILLHSNPIKTGIRDEDGYVVSFNDVYSTDPITFTVHTLSSNLPTLFKNCTVPKIIVSELPRRMPTAVPALYDFVFCNLSFENFELIGMEVGSMIRVQNSVDDVYKINDDGKKEIIPPFFKVV